MERRGDNEERDRPDRQVDVEDPAPREVVDEEATKQRADDRCESEDATEDALIATTVAWRDDVANGRDRGDDQPTRTKPLNRPVGDQRRHRVGEATQRRTAEKDDDRNLEHELAAVEVAEFAVDRARNRRGEQVGRDDPREVLETAEVSDDRRQGGGDDRLVERREEHHEHQCAEDDAHAWGRNVGWVNGLAGRGVVTHAVLLELVRGDGRPPLRRSASARRAAVSSRFVSARTGRVLGAS